MSSSLSSFMAHTAVLVKDLSDTHRLPPTYVGVRRVRPSTKQVQSAWVGAPSQSLEAVVFKVTTEDGAERRMTTQEKKELKIKLRKERYEANKHNKSVQKGSASSTSEQDGVIILSTEKEAQLIGNSSDSKYLQLQVNSSALEEELADLRGDRHGVPPVVLSPPLALQAQIVALNQGLQRPTYRLDDEFSKTLAAQLKQSMLAAEKVRQGEDLRPMAYQVVPEVWTRMRPDSLKDGVEGTTTTVKPNIGITVALDDWSLVTMRQCQHLSDSANTALVDLFYHHSPLHVSCGIKFGCDYLLYDGPRNERHAFAGLRVLAGAGNPYDLAGYVRGLNTAGKLALVASVDDDGRIALVDLALEKILSAPTHLKRKRIKARKEVGQKLAKPSY
jgi:hypothetical protein